jgi:hypothetical protein
MKGAEYALCGLCRGKGKTVRRVVFSGGWAAGLESKDSWFGRLPAEDAIGDSQDCKIIQAECKNEQYWQPAKGGWVRLAENESGRKASASNELWRCRAARARKTTAATEAGIGVANHYPQQANHSVRSPRKEMVKEIGRLSVVHYRRGWKKGKSPFNRTSLAGRAVLEKSSPTGTKTTDAPKAGNGGE